MELRRAQEIVAAVNAVAVLALGGLAAAVQTEAVHIRHEASTLNSEDFAQRAEAANAKAQTYHNDALGVSAVGGFDLVIFSTIGVPALLRRRRLNTISRQA